MGYAAIRVCFTTLGIQLNGYGERSQRILKSAGLKLLEAIGEKMCGADHSRPFLSRFLNSHGGIGFACCQSPRFFLPASFVAPGAMADVPHSPIIVGMLLLFSLDDIQHFLVKYWTSLAVMNLLMAVWTKRGHVPRVVWSAVSQSMDVVRLQIGSVVLC